MIEFCFQLYQVSIVQLTTYIPSIWYVIGVVVLSVSLALYLNLIEFGLSHERTPDEFMEPVPMEIELSLSATQKMNLVLWLAWLVVGFNLDDEDNDRCWLSHP